MLPRTPHLLVALGLLLALVAAGTAQAQIWQLPREGATPGDHFGSAVAVDGDRLVVGASGEPACGPNTGAAYIYERDRHGTFRQVARLRPEPCEEGTFFGRRVAVAGDAVAIAAGGEVGAPWRVNAVHIFEPDDDGRWHEVDVLTPPQGAPEAFASAIVLGEGRLVVASRGDTAHRRYHGTVHVYERGMTGWALEAELRPNRGTAFGVFGSDVALDGSTIAVAASPYGVEREGSVYVFEQEQDGAWSKRSFLPGFVGQKIPVALTGPLLAVGEPGAGPARAGAATIFGRRRAGGWARLATLRSHVPYEDGAFGTLVAADSGPDGPRVLAVGYSEQLGRGHGIDRVVHVFGYDGEIGWRQRQVLDLGDWAFAMDLDLSELTAVAGRASDDAPGAAYVILLLQ